MTYKTFLRMVPPTATDQHMGHRVATVNGRQVVMSYRKKPQQQAHAKYEDFLKHDISTRQDGIGSTFMFTKPVQVWIQFKFPHTSNVAKRDRNKTFLKTTRPDLDNMAKGLMDCITNVGILQDDALVWRLELEKFMVPANKCGVYIEITDDEEKV